MFSQENQEITSIDGFSPDCLIRRTIEYMSARQKIIRNDQLRIDNQIIEAFIDLDLRLNTLYNKLMRDKCNLLRSKLINLDIDIYRKEIKIKMGKPLDKLFKSMTQKQFVDYEKAKYKIDLQKMETKLVADYK